MPYGEKKGGPQMGHSPAEMGHSPMQNHHYGMRKGESVKQERKNLMQDMPIDNRATSWMSKHSKSAMMMKGPMEMGHSPAEMGHEGSPAKHELKDPTKGTHWHAEDGTIVTEKEGRKDKKKLPTGPNVPKQRKSPAAGADYDSRAGNRYDRKKGGPQMSHSPAEMDHSPLEGHCMGKRK